MSFAADFLDGLPILYKRTEGTLKATHEVASFLNKVAATRKEYLTKMKGIITTYAQRKLLSNADLDFTLKRAVEASISALDETVAFETAYTQHLVEISAEIEAFRKEKDMRRKKLQSDGELLVKELAAQHEFCRKTKMNYMSLSREADKQQAALVKASSDPSVKTGKLAQMSTRTSMAVEKARSAEAEYKDVVRQTNEKQNSVYTREMPNLLLEFQNFEEDRIRFLQDRLKRLAGHLQEWPEVFSQAGKKCADSAAAISVSDDIVSFVQANKTGKTPPPPVEVELYSASHQGGGVPPAPSSSSTLSTSTAAAAASAPSAAPGGGAWGLGPDDKDLPVEKKQNKLEAQLQKLESQIRADEQGAQALEKMAVAYAKDPEAKKKADNERAEFEKRIAEAKEHRDKVHKELNALGSGTPAKAPEIKPPPEVNKPTAPAPEAGGGDAKEVQVKVRGLYDYTATCDTELSFKEGEIFTVTEQDQSGWWYATIGEKQGFVPENYVEVVK